MQDTRDDEVNMELEEIKKIIELMNENCLNEFELEENGKRITIKKGQSGPVLHAVQAVAPQVLAAVPAAKSAAPAVEAPAVEQANLVEIKAPFVGTFYRSPSPESESYVNEGQEVNPDTVLCIVEAMKVMNEIKAEIRGIVRAILVENAHAVQYGQPLFKIEKI
jgi:acetyl-CoA carboxylase biotin carboxyl carrier protein